MNENGSSATYFLSYSRADQDVALRLAKDLRANEISVWVDQLDIRPSEHWDRAIERAVRDCCGLLVILSPRSAASDNVADEISFALDHGKSVLPVMIERCRLPLRISRMQVIDATAGYEQGLDQCLTAIKGNRCGTGATQQEAPQVGFDDAKTIAETKGKLTSILGPIAAVLVDKEATKAQSAADLYARLAEHISGKKDRAAFIASVSDTSAAPLSETSLQASIPDEQVNAAIAVLTKYLGPIASVVARREGAAAKSITDLHERLAQRIPNERERADFMRRVGSG